MSTSSKAITPLAQDSTEWYQDVIAAADLAEHSDVKGAMIFKPYGYALWERIHDYLDHEIKVTGHQNVYFPLFIPKSYLSKEAEHVEGFAKETYIVTHHRLKASDGGVVVDPEAKLPEELIVRPTSETVIHAAFARWIKSWRDLPVLINQWANVFRAELRPRMFLRTTEFLWQEGHTAHATEAEAEAEARKMLNVYQKFAQDILAIPVISGAKSDSERFAGALRTYTIEAMMLDGKALQAGTSHNLGQNFAKAFDVQFLDQANTLQYVWMTSWGVSTRLIGGLILSHSDDKGLVLPPNVAPIQVVIVPIARDEATRTALDHALAPLFEALAQQGVRLQVDRREHLSFGEKLFEWEKKGVPLRIEIGPKDLEQHQLTYVRRINDHKETAPLANFGDQVPKILEEIQKSLLDAAQTRLKDQTRQVDSYTDFAKLIEAGGFFLAGWCGDAACEERLKAETKATIRCIPFDQPDHISDCLLCSKTGTKQVIVARAY